jgi:hypothetical protein
MLTEMAGETGTPELVPTPIEPGVEVDDRP